MSGKDQINSLPIPCCGRFGFDHEKYIEEQSSFIVERVQTADRIYLEVGGKIEADNHASRIFPGFRPNGKICLFGELAKKVSVEAIVCIHADIIGKNKIRSDQGITYEESVIKLIDTFRSYGIEVAGVMVTRSHVLTPGLELFVNTCKRHNVSVFFGGSIPGYPHDLEVAVSEQGLGSIPYIPVKGKVVIVSAPGAGSGKLATCISQIYHESTMNLKPTYSKWESFPVWNLPLDDPVNIAYEAASCDLETPDYNVIDPYHLEAYGEKCVNYNRDVDAYPVVKHLLEAICGESPFKSPTDMGVNCLGFAIVDRELVNKACIREIFRRAWTYKVASILTPGLEKAIEVSSKLASQWNEDDYRPVVSSANNRLTRLQQTRNGTSDPCVSVAIELHDGTVITGVNSELLHATAACLLNSLKHLAGIADERKILVPAVIEAVTSLKKDVFCKNSPSLTAEEALMALSFASITSSEAADCLSMAKKLRGCDFHSTHIPSPGDINALRRLGILSTSSPEFINASGYIL